MKASPAREHEAQHGALMDGVYRYQRHVYDLTRKYFLFGRDRMLNEMRLKPDARVLEIGCGTARNLIKLGSINPTADLYGLDASDAMLKTATKAIARAKMSDRVHLTRAFAESASRELFGSEAGFDAAIFSYSLSMIPDWRAALVAAAEIVESDGTIRIVDFGDLKTLWPPLAHGLRAWLTWFHVSPRVELLGVLEKAAESRECSLRILPFRYAFILTASPGAIRAIASGG
ncbi:MAG TPA: methyltransferase [Micropepsaceae bacterium]|nr:methyltransferase [Micropepsaceae bacterium]